MTAIGIDISKRGFVLCAAQPDTPPRQWTVEKIDYADQPHWRAWLRQRAAGAIVCAEPTGWHYLAPIAAVLHSDAAAIYLVNHAETARMRDLYISSAKTDALDARAIALIAHHIEQGTPPRGTRLYDHQRSQAITTLRLIVNTHERLTRQTTRLSNQLDAIGHSIDPVLASRRVSWLSAVSLGAISPAQIHQLATLKRPADTHGATWRSIRDLAALLVEDIDVSPDTAVTIADLAGQLADFEQSDRLTVQRITELLNAPPFARYADLWRSVPYASDLAIAALLIATHGQPEALTKDEFKSAVGSNPLSSESGQANSTKPTRKGYRPSKKQLYLWTMALIRHGKNPIAVYYAAHQNIRRPIYAARNKLARVLWGIIQSNTPCTWADNPRTPTDQKPTPKPKRGSRRKGAPMPDDQE